LIGSARMACLLSKDGCVSGGTAVYLSCGLGTVVSAALGSAPIFVSMSGSAGIREGGRTGLTSIFLGLYALVVAFVFSPLAAAIPHCAVAPVLIFVGASMIGEAKEVAWWRMHEALPAFMCAIFQPFTYSVSNGIYAGISLAIVLFFTTGSFLSYLPSRVKNPPQLNPSVLNKIALDPSVLNEIARETGRASAAPTNLGRYSKHHSMFKCMSEIATHDDQPVGFPKFMSKVDSFTHDKALKAIGSTASLFGLDKTEVEGVAEDRLLNSDRNLEGHCFGGISGCDLEETCRTLPSSGRSFEGQTPRISAALRRMNSGCEVRVMQTFTDDE